MFIDIHAHAYRIQCPPYNGREWFHTTQQLLDRYDACGIERGCLLPLVHSEVYFPQAVEDIIEMAETYPDRFIPFCNVDPRLFTNTPDAPLGDALRYYKDKGCKGLGEVMPHLPFLDPRVQNLFRHCEDVGFPLTFDISARKTGDYGLYDDPGLPQLETCLRRFPKLRILGHGPAFWAEIAELRTPADRDGYPKYPVEVEGVVPKLFRRYENLYADLSAGSGHGAMARDPEYAAQFLNEFQGRALFGLDLCAPNPGAPLPIAEFLKELRESGGISEEVFSKITRENAIRLLELDI